MEVSSFIGVNSIVKLFELSFLFLQSGSAVNWKLLILDKFIGKIMELLNLVFGTCGIYVGIELELKEFLIFRAGYMNFVK